MTNDFIEYWSAANLLLHHGNAYSPAELLAVQRSAGWTDSTALLMWNPPWTLTLLAPLGLLDHDTAQFLWFVIHALIIFVGAQLLWRVYSATPALSCRAWIALFAFAPVYLVLLLGQIAPLILAGLIGFLLAARRGAWFCAGAWLALAAIKPHLFYLLWLAVLLWVLHERQWRLAAGFGLTLALMAGAPLIFDGQIYARYLALLADGTVIQPQQWATPTLGNAVNLLLGGLYEWLRWLPALVGAVWFTGYWSMPRSRWDWPSQLPLIILVSVASAPFAWSFDHVVLLPALMQCAAQERPRPGWPTVWFFLLNFATLAAKLWVRNDFWYFWLAPGFLLLYVWSRYERKIVAGSFAWRA